MYIITDCNNASCSIPYKGYEITLHRYKENVYTIYSIQNITIIYGTKDVTAIVFLEHLKLYHNIEFNNIPNDFMYPYFTDDNCKIEYVFKAIDSILGE